jgi:hypothetical protein
MPFLDRPSRALLILIAALVCSFICWRLLPRFLDGTSFQPVGFILLISASMFAAAFASDLLRWLLGAGYGF